MKNKKLFVRMRRRHFVVLTAAFFGCSILTYSVLSKEDASMALVALCFVALAVLCVVWFYSAARRLNDFNEPGWKTAYLLIPLFNLFWLVVLLTTDGTIGKNQYGEDPRYRLPFYVED